MVLTSPADTATAHAIVTRLVDALPAYTRLWKDKKRVFADGSQIDLLILEDRKAVSTALARMSRRVAAGGLEAATAENLAGRLARLDRTVSTPEFVRMTPAERMALYILTGWTMAEMLLLDVRDRRGNYAALGDFFGQRCLPLSGLVRDLLPGAKPAWFPALLPLLARATES